MPRWATALKFVIPTGADPDFPLRGTHPGLRVRLSVESRMKLANATKLDRKSAVAEGEDLQFLFRVQANLRGRVASGFRFSLSINANCRSLRYAALRSG